MNSNSRAGIADGGGGASDAHAFCLAFWTAVVAVVEAVAFVQARVMYRRLVHSQRPGRPG